MSGETTRVGGLDVLRALAVLSVFAFHYPKELLPGWLVLPGLLGWLGVDLFFVLSGYLIASQWLAPFARGQRSSLLGFYQRRAFRILPAYSTALTLYFGWAGFHEVEALPPLWRFLTFTQNLGLDRSAFGTFSHAWSLCVEEHFYLLFPAASLLVLRYVPPRRAWAVFAGVFGLGLVVRWVAWGQGVGPLVAAGADPDAVHLAHLRTVFFPTWCRLDGLLCGVALASVRVFQPERWARLTARGNWALAAGSLWLLVVPFLFLPSGYNSRLSSVLLYPAESLGFALLVLAGASPSSLLNRFRYPGAAGVAAISYPLYLVHKGVAHLVLQAAEGWALPERSGLLFGLSLALACAAAALVHVALEKPFLRLRDLSIGHPTDIRSPAR